MQFCRLSHSSKTVDPKCLLFFELRKNCDLALKVVWFSCPIHLNSYGREKAREEEERRVIQSCSCPSRWCLAASAMHCSSEPLLCFHICRLWLRAITEVLQASPDGESLLQLCILREREKERAVWGNGVHVSFQRPYGHVFTTAELLAHTIPLAHWYFPVPFALWNDCSSNYQVLSFCALFNLSLSLPLLTA